MFYIWSILWSIVALITIGTNVYNLLDKRSRQLNGLQRDVDRRRREAGWGPAEWPQKKLYKCIWRKKVDR